MTAHPILTAHPAYQKWEAHGVDLVKRRASLARQGLAAFAERDKVRVAHAEAVRVAVEKSKPIPATPEPADLSHLDAAMTIQEAAEEAHRDRRAVMLTEIAADGGLLGVEERLGAALAKVADAAPAIKEAQDDLVDTLAVYRDMLRAQDRAAGVVVRPSRADRVRLRWDVDALLSADVGALMALEPVQATGPTILPGDADSKYDRTMATHNRLIAEEILQAASGGGLGMTVDTDRIRAFGNRTKWPVVSDAPLRA
jgi:hypothetical protein